MLHQNKDTISKTMTKFAVKNKKYERYLRHPQSHRPFFLQVTLLIPKGNVVARLEVKAHSLVPEANFYIPSTINTGSIYCGKHNHERIILKNRILTVISNILLVSTNRPKNQRSFCKDFCPSH